MSNIDSRSRYAWDQSGAARVYRDLSTGEEFLATRVPRVMAPASDDRPVRPRPGERWEQFAARVWPELGDDALRLWSLLLDLNDITNPFDDPDPSKPLRVPSADRVLLEVLE